jgi:ABC-type nitrate/sulfonate/bicarbonate transport system substrate-binding protein
VAESTVGARQVGRRATIVCGALVVAPTSSVFTPQELAHRPVGLDYGNGTAYAGLQMLEGAMPRAAVTTCAAATSPAERFAGLMRGDFEATVLQEPWITVAEKAGCRLVSTTFFHGTWVATRDVRPEAYAALLRAITRAVHRINADKRRYVSYFLRDWAGHPEVDALSPEDFNLSRIQLKEPTPIPEAEARWAWDWMASWGLLEGTFDLAGQIDRGLEHEAHALAGTAGAGAR